MLRHRINFAAFTFSFLLIGLLTIVSFFGAWAYDEGTASSFVLASLFKILRFPTHTLFWDYFNQTTTTFYLGLLINVFLFAFVTERLISFIKRQRANG
jgi:hypothetical protein